MRIMSRLAAILVLGLNPLSWGQCWPCPGPVTPARQDRQLRSLIQELPDYEKTTLTGDWNGARRDLAERGILFELDLSQYAAVNAHGEVNTNHAVVFPGTHDYYLRLDFARMGLWEGGLLTLHGQTHYARSINCEVGANIPVDFDSLQPVRDASCVTALSEFYYAQALSEKFILALGKIDIIGGREDELLGTQERDQFLNTGLRTNPAVAPFIPYTPLALAAIYLPNKWVRLTSGIMDNDPGTTATTPGFRTAFHGRRWFTVGQNLDVTVKPFGKEGHYTVGYVWMNRGYRLLEDAPTCSVGVCEMPDLVRPALLIDGLNLARQFGLPPFFRDYYDCVHSFLPYGKFDQFLYTEPDDPKQGWGVFGRVAVSDGHCNPIEAFYAVGLGGRGSIPGRDRDNWGIGYYYANFSDQLPNILKIHSEQGVEAFYNIELRPGVRLTPDLQVIMDPGGGRGNSDTAIVASLRLQIYF